MSGTSSKRYQELVEEQKYVERKKRKIRDEMRKFEKIEEEKRNEELRKKQLEYQKKLEEERKKTEIKKQQTLELVKGPLMIEINEKKHLIQNLKDSIKKEEDDTEASLVEQRKIIQEALDALNEKLKTPREELVNLEKNLKECINNKNKIIQPYCPHTNITPDPTYSYHGQYGNCDECNAVCLIKDCGCYMCNSSYG